MEWKITVSPSRTNDKSAASCGPVHILAGGLVQDAPIQLNTFELPVFILIKGADPHIADALPFRVAGRSRCGVRFFDLPHLL